MMEKSNLKPNEVLQKYWGFSSFRFPQQDIIESILAGKDTLALLPTGGGKSICFQIPALILEGTCLVISPLISLMKDQVQNLKKRNIKASAVVSGMRENEIETVLENCKAGKIKILYVSPERLQSEIFKERLLHVKISFIAVDEAHCISQWGYDFRPPYLKIADFRTLYHNLPVMALTATATPNVVIDIQEKLQFKKPNVFSKSFSRSNLAYQVYFEENKWKKLIDVLHENKGSGIVYTRSRKLTEEIAKYLNKAKISADYYHAGLSAQDRDIKQKNWVFGKTRIICATNAFGMGIDKPDVRLVIHMNIPDNLESYFQEAGRGGRDEKFAKAITLFENADISILQDRANQAFPPKPFIKSVYTALGNYFQLPNGSGKEASFEFDIEAFTKRYNFKMVEAYNALKILEKDEYIALTDFLEFKSRLNILVPYRDFYELQLKNKKMEFFLKTLLRNYPGLFDQFVKINENKLAKTLGSTTKNVEEMLHYLHKTKVVDYAKASNKPQIIYTQERIAIENVTISKANYETRKEVHLKRVEAMVNFLTNNKVCRSRQLLAYFGEKNDEDCKVCDVCLKKYSKHHRKSDLVAFTEKIRINTQKPIHIQELAINFKEFSDEFFLENINNLINNGILLYDNHQKITWHG